MIKHTIDWARRNPKKSTAAVVATAATVAVFSAPVLTVGAITGYVIWKLNGKSKP